MSKISIEEVEAVLRKQNVDVKIVKNVIDELVEVVKEEKDSRATGPKQKNEFLIVLSDPNNELAGKDFVGWVVQMKDGDDAGLVLGKIQDAARDQNAAKKRKRGIINNMVEAFSGVKRRFLKPKDIMIKTKEPVRCLVTDGKL